MRSTGDPRTFYGRWAGLYDRLATLPGVDSWRGAAADALDLRSGETAVEMGCGTGANLPALRERVGESGRIVGVDLTRGMLDRARNRGGALVQADASRPPIDGRVDGLLATFVVGLFEEPGAVVDRWCDLADRVALLHFAASERAWARPLNAAYRGFVWLSATDKRTTGAARSHDARVRAAHERLAERTVDHREERLAGGYLRLAGGRVA